MPFSKLGLLPALLRNVRELGFTEPTPIQAKAIPLALDGGDLVATAQTGSGKTAAFALPTLQRLLAGQPGRTRALTLVPTRELAQQVHAVGRGLMAGLPLRSTVVIGGAGLDQQARALGSGVDWVVATPGRLLDHLNRGWDLDGLETLILDEADHMFDLGFFPTLKRIVARLPANRQTLLFSATMPPEVAQLARSILRQPRELTIGTQGAAAGSVSQVAYQVPGPRKTALLLHLLDSWEMPSALVFCRTRRGAKKLAQALADAGLPAAELHGNRTPSQRQKAMDSFRSGRVRLMVATNIAARGIDVKNITHVVNFEVPDAAEDYVHRIGRTGRAGEDGDALILYSPEEHHDLTMLERRLRQPIERRHAEGFDYGPNHQRAERHPAPLHDAAPYAARKPHRGPAPRPGAPRQRYAAGPSRRG